jgi:Zn-dependent protease with chaperone function
MPMKNPTDIVERLAAVEVGLSYIKEKVDSIDKKLPSELAFLPQIKQQVDGLGSFRSQIVGMAIFVGFIASLLTNIVISQPAKPSSATEVDQVQIRFNKLIKGYDFKAPTRLEKCGQPNAFSDGFKIVMCRETMELTQFTDDMFYLVMFHEQGHHVNKHSAKRAQLIKAMESLSPSDETFRIFKQALISYIRQNEYEADEYSLVEAKKFNLSVSACNWYKLIDPNSTVTQDDSQSTHPASWKRMYRCKEVLGAINNIPPQDSPGGLIGRERQNHDVD